MWHSPVINTICLCIFQNIIISFIRDWLNVLIVLLFWVYLGVKTCEFYLYCVSIVKVRVYYIDFFVLRYWRVLQVLTTRMSPIVSPFFWKKKYYFPQYPPVLCHSRWRFVILWQNFPWSVFQKTTRKFALRHCTKCIDHGRMLHT